MGTIDENGYTLKTENEYFQEERDFYLDIDPNWNVDPSTPDGLKIAHDAEVFAFLDESGLLAYNSKDPNKAIGVDLNTIGYLTGSARSLGTPSTVTLNASGVNGTIIPAGSTVRSTADGSEWTTDSAATISAGVANIPATCTVNGATQADIGALTEIVDTVAGWQSVTNLAIATPGTNSETDGEFRLRRNKTVGRPGNNQVDSALGEIGAVDGVRRFKSYENFTSSAAVDPTYNPHGLPAHSMSYIVDGGLDDDIAQAIYLKKNPGVNLNSAGTPVSVVVTSTDYPFNSFTVDFSRPIYIDITVIVDITDDGTLPANADELVAQSILDYTQGDLLNSDVGFNATGFDIGETVYSSRLYTPINKVIGSYGNSFVTSLTVDGGGGPASSVAIAFNELSRWSDVNITVNIT